MQSCAESREILRVKNLKKLKGTSVRMSDEFKAVVERRAAERDRNISEHITDLLLSDLTAQRKSRETLSDVCAEASNAIELASMGIDSDAQRIWCLRPVIRFAVHVLGSERRIA